MSELGGLRGLWYRWKSLRLPWRRQWLCGRDLAGNFYYEFRNDLGSTRHRRKVIYATKTHFGDVKLDPAWLQWLRHTRLEAPSVVEQQLELQRQAHLKQLAAAADARWEAKPRISDDPRHAEQPKPLLAPKDHAGYGNGSEPADVGKSQLFSMQEDEQKGLKNIIGVTEETGDSSRSGESGAQRSKGSKRTRSPESGADDPWEKHKVGPSEGWQPTAWTPGAGSRG